MNRRTVCIAAMEESTRGHDGPFDAGHLVRPVSYASRLLRAIEHVRVRRLDAGHVLAPGIVEHVRVAAPRSLHRS